jgi:hypothetical protein
MNVMIDFETMGHGPDAVVAALGACAFHPFVQDTYETIKANTNRLFYHAIRLDGQHGRRFGGETVTWWLNQSDEARYYITTAMRPVEEVIDLYAKWYRSIAGDEPAWAFGASFDHPIMEHLCTSLRIGNPTGYRDMLCARTVIRLAGLPKPELQIGHVDHMALSDSIRQVIWVQQSLKALGVTEWRKHEADTTTV